MKKLLLLGTIFGSLACASVQAQTYNPSYPSQVGTSYYNSRQPAPKNNILKNFSIGMDYVIGSTTVIDKDFTLESPLTGGITYNGKTTDFEDSISSLNGNIGNRPFKYFGIEAFYQQSLSDNQIKYQEHYSGSPKFAQAEYNIKYKAYGLDALFYLPIASRFEMIASAGIANYDFEAEARLNAYNNSSLNFVKGSSVNYDESKTVFRYGAGAQVWLSRRLTLRAMYRYIPIDGDFIDKISEVSVGVRYNF